MRKLLICIVALLLMTLVGVPVYAADIPPMPHAFYGTVEINDSQAAVGTRIEARGEGVEPGTYNPIITTEWGKYGSADPLGAKLVVQGDIEEDATITFYVNGVDTGQTYPFDSGEVKELPLSVTIEEEEEEGDGVGVGAAPYVETDLFGTTGSFRINDKGEILKTITATSTDRNLTITIPYGTIALDKNGNPLSSLTAVIDPSPPDPPEGANIIGLAYNFGPAGATFDPAITFTWSYDPDDIPDGVAEEDLVIAYYDGTEWVELDCGVNTNNNIITALVDHFTTFAIIAVAPPELVVLPPAGFSLSNLTVQPAEVQPNETVTLAVSVANTGGTEGSHTVVLKITGVKVEESRVTIAAGSSQIVRFSTSSEKVGRYNVTVDGLSASFAVVAPVVAPAPPTKPEEVEEVPAPGPNWLVISVSLGAFILIALLIMWFFVRRRA